MVGFLIGLLAGFIQFIMLCRFTDAVTKDGKIPILEALFQIFIPVIALLGCALLVPKELIWAAGGIVSFIIIGAVIKFIKRRKDTRN